MKQGSHFVKRIPSIHQFIQERLLLPFQFLENNDTRLFFFLIPFAQSLIPSRSLNRFFQFLSLSLSLEGSQLRERERERGDSFLIHDFRSSKTPFSILPPEPELIANCPCLLAIITLSTTQYQEY